jgi:hypothetical protein
MVLGILALVLFWIPPVGALLAGMGVSVGLFGVGKSFSRKRVGLGLCLAGIVVGCLGFIPLILIAASDYVEREETYQKELERLRKFHENRLNPNKGNENQMNPGGRSAPPPWGD